MGAIIWLNTLELKNFKGIKSLKINFKDTGETLIFGDNATGKTTVIDAWMWLLFDKNSKNEANFEIKTLDKDGSFIHGLDHSVEAEIMINDKPLTLKKIYSENWTKKRGSADKVFTGHSTECFVNGVPMKKSDHNLKIDSIVSEEDFKLLTDIRYFNEVMHWTDRRNLLLSMFGDVSSDDVINSNPKLKPLKEIFEMDRDIEEHRKVLKASQRKINDELKEIPARIDELNNSLNLEDLPESKDLDAKISQIKKEVDKWEKEFRDFKNLSDVSRTESQIDYLTEQIATEKARINRKEEEGKDGIRSEIRELSTKKDDLLIKESRLHREKKQIIESNNVSEDIVQKAQETVKTIKSRKFEYSGKSVCPACNQKLPKNQIDKARSKAEEEFNLEKSKELEQAENTITNRVAVIKENNDELSQIEKQLSNIKDDLFELEKEINKLQKSVEKTPKINSDNLKALDSQLKDLENQYEKQTRKKDKYETELNDQIEKHVKELYQLQRQKLRLEENTKINERILKLKDREKELATIYESHEKELFLTEEYMRTWVKMLEDKISSHFSYMKFKMFNELVSGGLEETCETVVDGVSYQNLNHGARINAGLDFIRAYQAYTDVKCPVFIDNAESIVKTTRLDSQVVKLIVSGEHKTLTIKNIKEAAHV